MIKRFQLFPKKKQIDPDHVDVKLEKNDFLAMFIAICQIVLPVLLGIFIFLALIILLFFG